MQDAERLDSRVVHRGKILDLSVDRVRLPNQEVADMEMVHHRGAAAVLPLLADGRALLLTQFRYPTGRWLLEVPAGKLDGDEEPTECARRELVEETGYRLDSEAGELHSLGWIWTSPGFTDEKIWLYLAQGLKEASQALERDEVLEVSPMPLEDVVERAGKGEIHDAKTVCTILRAARHLGV